MAGILDGKQLIFSDFFEVVIAAEIIAEISLIIMRGFFLCGLRNLNFSWLNMPNHLYPKCTMWNTHFTALMNVPTELWWSKPRTSVYHSSTHSITIQDFPQVSQILTISDTYFIKMRTSEKYVSYVMYPLEFLYAVQY